MKRGGAALVAACVLALGACTTDPVPPGLVGGGSEPAAAEPMSDVARSSLAAEMSPPESAAPASNEDTAPVAAVAGAFRVQFTPVMGAPAEELGPLNQRLIQRGAERGVAVTMGSDPGATHIVKGYFSTLKEAGGNTLVYVWDVFDRSGTRVHRIQGKEAALGQGAATALRTIADRTVDELVGWLATSQG